MFQRQKENILFQEVIKLLDRHLLNYEHNSTREIATLTRYLSLSQLRYSARYLSRDMPVHAEPEDYF